MDAIEIFGLIGIIVVAVLLIFIGPILALWSLNILGFPVAYNFWTWLAAFILFGGMPYMSKRAAK